MSPDVIVLNETGRWLTSYIKLTEHAKIVSNGKKRETGNLSTLNQSGIHGI